MRRITFASVILLVLVWVLFIGFGCISRQILTAQEVAEAFVHQRVTDSLLSPYREAIEAGDMRPEIMGLISVETSDTVSTLVHQTADQAVVEIKYHVMMHIQEQRILAEGDIPDVYMTIAPQTRNWDVYETVELSMAYRGWKVDDSFFGPAEKKLETEHQNIQRAVSAMLEWAETPSLDNAYMAVNTEKEVKGVTAVGGKCNLSNFYKPLFKYPYAQSYDIAKDGTVTVSKGRE